jgi:hypothetical protein
MTGSFDSGSVWGGADDGLQVGLSPVPECTAAILFRCAPDYARQARPGGGKNAQSFRKNAQITMTATFFKEQIGFK